MTSDAPMGPKAPWSTVLPPAEEAIVVEFRLRTLLLPKIGYRHIDSCERHYANGELIMLRAIGRISKLTDVAFRDSAGKMELPAFLRNVVAAFPDTIHTMLTKNDRAFADVPKNRTGPSRKVLGT